MRAKLSAFVFLCSASLAISQFGCGQEDRPDPSDEAKRPKILVDNNWPNVLLITLDSVRPDHLHCYGYERETSPNIDRLAAEGALFENCIAAAPWSLPTHASLFTGAAASFHGVEDINNKLPPAQITLAEDLRNAGYVAAGFYSNPLLHQSFGLAQGFNGYYRCLNPPPDDQTALDARATSPTVLAAAQAWIKKNDRKPFFMFVNFSDANFDYTPPTPYDKRFDPDYDGHFDGRGFLTDPRINPNMPEKDLNHLVALYDGEIAWVDEHVGKLLDAFKDARLLDSTIVVLTAGNGTAFFEHGFKGARNALFEEVIKVPLIIRWPGLVPAEMRCPKQARTIDVYPTISDLIGTTVPPVMGRSLAPVFTGQSIDVRGGVESAVCELKLPGAEVMAIRRPERKTIRDAVTSQGFVFDLIADPGELTAVADPKSPAIRGAQADVKWTVDVFFKEFENKFPPALTDNQPPPEIIQLLDAVGYVDGRLPARDVGP